MRIVVDTNVFVTALLQGRAPRKIYKAFLSGAITPIFSSETLAELVEVLSRPPLRVLMRESEVLEFLSLVRRDTLIVRSARKVTDCRDPKDNVILECALAGRAEYIVTGDKDLLVLNPFRGVRIISPADFVRLID